MGLIDLVHQVVNTLPHRSGGTGNRFGHGSAVVENYLNRAGADIPVGTVVRREGSGRVEPDPTDGSTDALGVIIGYYPDGDGSRFQPGDCPEDAQCAVMTKGRTRALVDSTGGYSGGDFIFVSADGDGTIKGDPTVDAGALGIFEAPGDAGALAWVHLYGAPVMGAGGGSVTWGTPAFTFGTSATAGATDEAVRRDAQIALFDGTSPSTIAVGDSAATGSAGKAARRDHAHGMAAFGNVTAQQTFGLSSANGSGSLIARNDHTHGTVPAQKWEVSATFTSVAANDEVWIRVPYACTMTGWDITANASGSAVVDVWQDTYANFPPTVADSIAGTNKPTLSSARKATSTLTGWGDATLDEGSYLVFHVDSVSGIATLNVVLYGTRTA